MANTVRGPRRQKLDFTKRKFNVEPRKQNTWLLDSKQLKREYPNTDKKQQQR